MKGWKPPLMGMGKSDALPLPAPTDCRRELKVAPKSGLGDMPCAMDRRMNGH